MSHLSRAHAVGAECDEAQKRTRCIPVFKLNQISDSIEQMMSPNSLGGNFYAPFAVFLGRVVLRQNFLGLDALRMCTPAFLNCIPSLQKRPRCCCKVRLRLPIIRTQVRKFPSSQPPTFLLIFQHRSHRSSLHRRRCCCSPASISLSTNVSHIYGLCFSRSSSFKLYVSIMPPFFLESVSPNVPQVEEMANLMTIATLPDGSVVQLDQFTRRMKEQIFDLLIARGLSSQRPPLDRLRHHVHPSYVRNKDDRLVHIKLSNILLAGVVSCERSTYTRELDTICFRQTALKEYSEDCLVFVIEQNVTSLNYKRPNQDTSAIVESMLYKIPTRLITVPSNEFRDLINAHCHEIALLIPAFLNSRRSRVGWSGDVSPYVSAFNLQIRLL